MAKNEKTFNEQNMRKIIRILSGLSASQQQLAEQCVNEYQADKTYSKDNICFYNGTLYRAKTVTLGNTPSPESAYFEMLDGVEEEIDAQYIETLMSTVSAETWDYLKDFINNDIISTTHAWSSSRAYSEIQNAIQTAKDYTLEQVANSSTGSYVIANGTDEVVDDKHLFLISNGSNYDIYALVNGAPTKIGDTSVSIDGLLTESTAESTYLKQSNAASTYATINAVDGLTTTVGEKVDKVSVLNTTSDSPTTDQIYNAQVINTELANKQTVLKHKLLSLDEINTTSNIELSYGYITPETAKSIGIEDATDFFSVIRLPWDNPYNTDLLISASGAGKMYVRFCDNGVWRTPYEIYREDTILNFKKLENGDICRFSTWCVKDDENNTLLSMDLILSDGNIKRIQFDKKNGELHRFDFNGADWIHKGKFLISNDIEPTSLANLNSCAISTYLTCDVDNAINAIKSGKVCQLNISGAVLVNEFNGFSNDIVISNIPEIYRPIAMTECTVYCTGNNNAIRAFLTPDGIIRFFSSYTGTAPLDVACSGYIFGTFTYITSL